MTEEEPRVVATKTGIIDVDRLAWMDVVKRPITVHAVQINESFTVATMEGEMGGKAGDYLMRGIRGEMYPCNQEVFNESYDVNMVECPWCPESILPGYKFCPTCGHQIGLQTLTNPNLQSTEDVHAMLSRITIEIGEE